MKKLLTILFICFAFISNAQTVSITSSATGSICAGTSVTFTATPSGYTTPSYQWYKNEIAISGETGATYTTTSLTNYDLIYVTAKDLNPPSGGSITTNGLIVQLDASDPTSYTSGRTWTDKKGNANGAINGGVSYVSNGSASYFSFPGTNNDYIKSSLNQAIKDFTIVFQPDFSSFNYSGGHTLFSKGPGVDKSMRFWSYNFSGLSNTNAYVWGAPNLNANENDWAGTNSLFLNGVNQTAGFAPLVYGWNILGGAGGSNGSANGSGFGDFPYCLGAGLAGRSFQGKIAIVLFYDRILNSTEQQQNFDALKSRFAFASNAIFTNVNASPSIPAITVIGDACVNKTTLSTPSGISSYSWSKDNVAITGATSNTYKPTVAGVYKVLVSNGTCSNTSAATTISNCGVTADGRMRPTSSTTTLLSNEGGINFGTGVNELGLIFNTTGLTTTKGSITATNAVLGGVISATNAITSSIGLVYSTDANFGTYSSSTILSNVSAGTYTSTISGLASSTNYYAKSFIINSAGTTFGNVVSFTTSAAFSAPIIVTNGLLLNLDAADPASYSGSGTTWKDLSGNNNNATLISGASYDATTGSIVTNGINQYITVPIFNTSITNITMQTWVYINANTKGSFMSNGGNDGYSIGIGSAELGINGNTPIMLFQAIRYIDAAPITYPTGWHLVTMTMDASAVPSIYIDDTYGNSFPGSNPRTPVTSNFNLGAVPADGGKYYNGKFATAYFYDRVLSASEITQNYNAVKARFGY